MIQNSKEDKLIDSKTSAWALAFQRNISLGMYS